LPDWFNKGGLDGADFMGVPRVCLIGFKKGGLDGAEFMVVVPCVCLIVSIKAG
jgi:hypothetical protein